MTDLEAYFERIGYRGAAAPSVETLTELHLLHPLAIPFENLSTLIGEPVLIDLDSIQEKLVVEQRGGYCFEQNRLFAAVLEQLGFRVTALSARVVWGNDTGELTPRTHMILLVDDDRLGPTIADVGFGGVTLTQPLTLNAGLEQQTPHDRFRLGGDGTEYVLEVLLNDEWRAMYRFDLQPQHPIDFEVANHYVSTHPRSHFLTTLMAAKPSSEGRLALVNNRLTTYSAAKSKRQETLNSANEIKRVLEQRFGIRLPHAELLDPVLERICDEAIELAP